LSTITDAIANRMVARPVGIGGGLASAATQSIPLKMIPAWTMAGVPTKAAVVAAASNPAQISRARVITSTPFAGGHLPPPLLRCDDLPRMDRGDS
jgi:hypothetical protein